MTKKNKKSLDWKISSLWGIFIFLLLIIIDQVTKILADAYQVDMDIIPGWLRLTIVYNPGISYGFGAKAPEWVKIGIVVLTGIMMVALTIVYFKVDLNKKLIRAALVLIVAGGVGNLIDRVYYKVWTLDNASANALQQGVRDMVDLSRFGFAVCNFADFFISAGAVMLVLSFLFFDKDAIIPVGKYRKMHLEEVEKQKEKESEKTE